MIRLEVENLDKYFGRKTVLEDLSFEQREGALGIGGRNGSGKSTLLRCLAGLERPSGGTITWIVDNERVKRSDIYFHLGFLGPHINLYEELSAAENLRFIASLRSLSLDDKVLQQKLKYVGLGNRPDQPFGSLSTGQQQRLKLAAALIHDPPILFLDEPGSNLDEEGRNLMREVVDEYRNSQRMVLLASNNAEELEWCDRRMLLFQ